MGGLPRPLADARGSDPSHYSDPSRYSDPSHDLSLDREGVGL
jgi:hypothetical protein